jgi:hypothetical protein
MPLRPSLLVGIFLFIFSGLRLQAKTVVIGTGSGSVIQNDMSGLSAGDILAIRPGVYREGLFAHLRGITIINHGGLVVFTGTVYCADYRFVSWKGTGARGLDYGFRFAGVSNQIGCFALDGHIEHSSWTNIEFINCGADAFGNQNYQTAYDGTHDSTKRLLHCRIDHIRMDSCGAFLTNFRGAFINVIDSCDFGYAIVDRPNTTTLIYASAIYRTSFHHWTIGQQICAGGNDVGCFQISGSPDIYDCSETGSNWGWFARIVQQSLNGRDDCHIYNNIRVGGSNYGFVDYRQEAAAYENNTKPYLRGGDMYIVNNTCGNMVTANNYLTALVVAYQFAGYHLFVWNNLRFHSRNQNQIPNEVNLVHYGSSADTILESNNYYVENPLLSGVLADTLHCFLKERSKAIDAGLKIPWITRDFGGIARPQGSRYDIGAREYTNKNRPPMDLGLPQKLNSRQ